MNERFNNIMSYVPPYNLFRLMEPGLRERSKLNVAGHIAYAIVGGLLFWGSFGIGVVKYGSQYAEKVFRSAHAEEIAKVTGLREKLFGENGLADTNGNQTIEFRELADVYERMGFGDTTLTELKFPEFTIPDLEKAVQSYEQEER